MDTLVDTQNMTPNLEDLNKTVADGVTKAVEKWKKSKPSPKRRSGTAGASANSQDNFEDLIPLITSCIIAGNEVTLEKAFASFLASQEEMRMKLVDERLVNDRLDAYNRQGNIILFGYEEPSKNYEPRGRESAEELEKALIESAAKVGVNIDPNNISDGFRLGKKPSGAPVVRRDGTNAARPILFKLNKRSKRLELLRKKKELKTNYGLKIAEDITPLRKALCDVANEIDSVKVAYPQDGKIFVRMADDPSKVKLRMESFLDLKKIDGFSGAFDWEKLKLDKLMK